QDLAAPAAFAPPRRQPLAPEAAGAVPVCPRARAEPRGEIPPPGSARGAAGRRRAALRRPGRNLGGQPPCLVGVRAATLPGAIDPVPGTGARGVGRGRLRGSLPRLG